MNRLMTWIILRNKTCTTCGDAATVAVKGRTNGYRRQQYFCPEHSYTTARWTRDWDNRKEYRLP